MNTSQRVGYLPPTEDEFSEMVWSRFRETQERQGDVGFSFLVETRKIAYEKFLAATSDGERAEVLEATVLENLMDITSYGSND
jgi:hypothetical protein